MSRDPLAERSKVESEGHLSSAVSGVLSRLRTRQCAERRTVDRGDGRRKVGVVKDIGEGRFKARMKFLRDAKLLGYPKQTAEVPGPCRMPTPAFPKRPAPAGVGENAARLKYCARDWPV